MAVGWLDRAAYWWHKLEINVDCVDGRRGQHSGFGFCFDFLLWVLGVSAGLWWWRRRVVVVVEEMGSLRVG